jgi:hypothetical protein
MVGNTMTDKGSLKMATKQQIYKSKRRICELCLNPKRKTTHLEANFRIWAVHEECYKQATKELHAFFDKYGIGVKDFKTKSVGKKLIHEWILRC